VRVGVIGARRCRILSGSGGLTKIGALDRKYCGAAIS